MRALAKCYVKPTKELESTLTRLALDMVDSFSTTELALFLWSASKIQAC